MIIMYHWHLRLISGAICHGKCSSRSRKLNVTISNGVALNSGISLQDQTATQQEARANLVEQA
jgi:hypothetical protein